MEAQRKRQIKSGSEFDHYFPTATGKDATIRKNANVHDTVAFIPKVVQETLHHTARLANFLKATNSYETCKNIWHFVYEHINYKKDQPGYEQIRSPARVWYDRFAGVDCDCYSVFISSILSNLGIPHVLRITKYHRDYFQHIYPVVQTKSNTGQQKEIVLDCVTDQFNYEVPYSEKKDYPMDLQYLSGFDARPSLYTDLNDVYLMGTGDGMADLGRLIQKKMGQNKKAGVVKSKTPVLAKRVPIGVGKKATKVLQQKQTAMLVRNAKGKTVLPVVTNNAKTPKQKKKIFGKMLNVVNKVNPATVLLRNGILASMKLNTRNVAARLRWSYLSPEQAAAKSIDPVKLQKLVAARQKLEKIFFGAGGNPNNLRKAILEGKGNKDRALNGLGELGLLELEAMQGMNEHTALPGLLGPEIYYDENINGMQGFGRFGQLGEPITLSSIAAAAGVIAGIVAMLKDVGNIFQKKNKGSEDFDESTNAKADQEAPVPPAATPPIVTVTDSDATMKVPGQVNTELPVVTTNNNNNSSASSSPTEHPEDSAPASEMPPAAVATTETPPAGNGATNLSFWEKNKSWLKPVAIGVGGITVIGLGMALMKGGKSANKSSPPGGGLSGTPGPYKRKNHYRANTKKKKHPKKKAIALL